MSNDGRKTGEQQGETTLLWGSRLAWLGGVIAALVAFIGQMLVGYVYNGFQARDLIQALIPPAQSLGGAVVQATATILALMLTLLSLSQKEIADLERGFFHRISRIALLTSITLASAILLLLFLSIPLQQSKTLPVYWFQTIYYALIVIMAGIAGLVVGTVILLYSTIESVIKAVRPTPQERSKAIQDAKNSRGGK